jgi:hypothetical protein
LRGSKMYYCFERCLRVEPAERAFLYFWNTLLKKVSQKMKPPLLQVGVSIFNYVCVEDRRTYVEDTSTYVEDTNI